MNLHIRRIIPIWLILTCFYLIYRIPFLYPNQSIPRPNIWIEPLTPPTLHPHERVSPDREFWEAHAVMVITT
jgi:hypothetical protein